VLQHPEGLYRTLSELQFTHEFAETTSQPR
jgi:hypothetical protein